LTWLDLTSCIAARRDGAWRVCHDVACRSIPQHKHVGAELGLLAQVEGAGIAQSVQRQATGWTVRESNPGRAIFFAHVHTGPGAHPASCTMGTGSMPGVKRPGRGADHPSYLAPRSRNSRAITLPHPLSLWAFSSVRGTYNYLFTTSRRN
jgi:hypothetical protein